MMTSCHMINACINSFSFINSNPLLYFISPLVVHSIVEKTYPLGMYLTVFISLFTIAFIQELKKRLNIFEKVYTYVQKQRIQQCKSILFISYIFENVSLPRQTI